MGSLVGCPCKRRCHLDDLLQSQLRRGDSAGAREEGHHAKREGRGLGHSGCMGGPRKAQTLEGWGGAGQLRRTIEQGTNKIPDD